MTILVRDSQGTIDSPWGKLKVKPVQEFELGRDHRCWHSGYDVEFTADEQTAKETEEFVCKANPYKKKQEIIEVEERRINAGVEVNGVQIKCDDQSVSRIHGMLKKAERLEAQGKPVSIKFKTAAGVTVVVTSAAEAGVIYDAISGHVGDTLERSSDLQDRVTTEMTPEEIAEFNPSDDANWEQ